MPGTAAHEAAVSKAFVGSRRLDDERYPTTQPILPALLSLFYEWVGSLRVGWVGGRRGGTEGHLGMDIYRIGMGGTDTQVPSIVIPV